MDNDTLEKEDTQTDQDSPSSSEGHNPLHDPIRPPGIQNIMNPFSKKDEDRESQGMDAKDAVNEAQNIFKAARGISAPGIGQGAAAGVEAAATAETALSGAAAAESAIGAAAAVETSAIGGAAAAEAGAVGAATAPAWLPWAIAGAIIFLIILILFFFKPFGGGKSVDIPDETTTVVPGGPSITHPPIPGLTLTLEGPESSQNGSLISYNVVVKYDAEKATVPIDQITVFNDIPEGTAFDSATGEFIYSESEKRVSWKLSELKNQNGFTVTLKPVKEDFVLSNKLYATAAGAATPSGAPPPTGGVCSVAESGFCSVENLKPYFGGNEENARKASIICKRESGGVPTTINKNCGTNDYSVGLFQINLVAHCPGAYGNLSCQNLISEEKRKTCEARLLDPVENIRAMARLACGQQALGTSTEPCTKPSWGPWYTPVNNSCGIY